MALRKTDLDKQSVLLFTVAIAEILLALLTFIVSVIHTGVLAFVPKGAHPKYTADHSIPIVVASVGIIISACLGIAGFLKSVVFSITTHFVLKIISATIDAACIAFSAVYLLPNDANIFDASVMNHTSSSPQPRIWDQSLVTLICFYIFFTVLHAISCVISMCYAYCCMKPRENEPRVTAKKAIRVSRGSATEFVDDRSSGSPETNSHGSPDNASKKRDRPAEQAVVSMNNRRASSQAFFDEKNVFNKKLTKRSSSGAFAVSANLENLEPE